MAQQVSIQNAAKILKLYSSEYGVDGPNSWSDADISESHDVASSALEGQISTLRKAVPARRLVEVQEIAPLLRSLHVFKSFSETARLAFCRVATWLRAGHGERLYGRGDTADTFYLVLEGCVSIVSPKDSPSGKAVVLATKSARQGFGDLALVENIPRSSDAVVESEAADLLLLRREDYLLTLHALQAEEILTILRKPTSQRSQEELVKVKKVVVDNISFLANNHSMEVQLSLCSFMEVVHFSEAGSLVFKEGDPGDGMYIVFSAEVEIVLDAQRPRQQGPLSKRAKKIAALRTLSPGNPTEARARRKSIDDGTQIKRIPSDEMHGISLFERSASTDSNSNLQKESSLNFSRRGSDSATSTSDEIVKSPLSTSPRRSPTSSNDHSSSPISSIDKSDYVIHRCTHGDIFGEPSFWQKENRAASARTSTPGYLIKLHRTHFRRIVQQEHDASNEVLFGCLRSAFKIRKQVSNEFMHKLANHFSERMYRQGQHLAVQGTPIQDIFVVMSGFCSSSLELKMVQTTHTETDSTKTSQMLRFNVATVGTSDNVGFVDFWTNREQWLTSYVAGSEMKVLQAPIGKVLSYLEKNAKDLASLKYQEAMKAKARAQRLKTKLHSMAKKAMTPATQENSELRVLENLIEPPAEDPAFGTKLSLEDIVDNDNEFVSKEKEKLLADKKFFGAHLHAAREAKQVPREVLPKLNLHAVATKHRIEALATATRTKMKQSRPHSRDKDVYMGLQRVPRGCWLSPRVARGEFIPPASQAPRGKWADEAMQTVKQSKIFEPSAAAPNGECTGKAQSMFESLDHSSAHTELSAGETRWMMRDQILLEMLPAARHGGLAFLPRSGRRPRSRNFMLPSTVLAQRNNG